MTERTHGGYRAKHPEGSQPDPRITDAVRETADAGKISCAAAHKIAQRLGVPPEGVGKTIDLMEYRISKCQLGLFGYEPEKKIVSPAETVATALADTIRSALVDGRLPCRIAWGLSERSGISRMAVSSACEALGIKIKPCQLGAF